MDADMIKTSAQDQMEMLTSMMMHLDKLPDFPSAYQQIPEFPDIELSDGSATTATPNTNTTTATFPLTSPPLITPSSFMGPTINGQVGPSFPQNVVCPIESTSAMQKRNSMEAMREMIFRVAMMQPVQIDPESVRPPKRRNVRISKDPQSVAARHRRERISERIRILQRLVPGGTKMDTASMLDEAVHYVKFLKRQVQSLERASEANGQVGFAFPAANYSGFMKSFQPPHIVAGSVQMLR